MPKEVEYRKRVFTVQRYSSDEVYNIYASFDFMPRMLVSCTLCLEKGANRVLSLNLPNADQFPRKDLAVN